MLFSEQRGDAGLRFVDVNEDGFDDIIFSNGERYSLHLWKNREEGWSIKVIEGTRGQEGGLGPVIPMIVRADGTNNGAWFHSRSMWVQNEDTNRLPDLVDRLSFDDMLKDYRRQQEEQGRVARGEVTGKASRDAIRVRPGMKVELVASEPLVADPVAFDWGPDGALWVAEMGDYPNGATWNKPGDPIGEPGGRIKRLIDEDGDGKYDRSTVFLDKVAFPNGVKAWRKGVLVTAAPEIFYAEDTDGDGDRGQTRDALSRLRRRKSAASRERLALGIGQLAVPGQRRQRRDGQVPEDRPDGRHPRPRFADSTGYRRVGSRLGANAIWSQLRRLGQLVWRQQQQSDVALRLGRSLPATQSALRATRAAIITSRINPARRRSFPTSRTLTRFNDFDKADRFTSACSPMVYRDELLFARDQRSGAGSAEDISQAFICEPVHNLVHREIVTTDGATFASQRASDEQDSEFLASSDNWFRPTMVRTGPDGALWISDMYRLVIEHPEWIPAAWQETTRSSLGTRHGTDLSRGSQRRRTAADHATGPARYAGVGRSARQPQRLAARYGAAAVPVARRCDRDRAVATTRHRRRTSNDAVACSLYARRPECAFPSRLPLEALQDEHPGVRRHAIRIAERYINTSARSCRRRSDRSRQMMTCRCGCKSRTRSANGRMPQSGGELARLAMANRDDPFLVAAALSGIREDNIANAIGVALPDAAAQSTLVEHLLSIAISIGKPELLQDALRSVFNKPPSGFAPWQFATATTVLHALDRRKLDRAKLFDARTCESTSRIAIAKPGESQPTTKTLEPERLVCIELLGVAAANAEDLAALAELLGSRSLVRRADRGGTGDDGPQPG